MLNMISAKVVDKPRLMFISPDMIVPNKYQPRKDFDESKLYELSRSIKEHGILQPLTVKQIEKDLYELIAGERRLRAAKLIGLATVPVIVKKFSREESMVLSIIENIQRHDLTFFEEADSYRKLIEECNLTQEELAKKLGKNQSTVANKLRLLKLEPDLKQIIIDNNLTERHARCLIKLDEYELREKAINEIISKNLNVAQTESLILGLLGEVKRENKKNHTKLRCVSLFKDLRIFSSTINQTVDLIRQSGLLIKSNKKETDDFIEYVIRVDKNLPNNK
ncbi:MAG: ParB/RepB/Spo0J family partition protein [Clostridia bacterium]|nr:ParB/RepB/Spo0J family partition protein [Clostridia bacterium]